MGGGGSQWSRERVKKNKAKETELRKWIAVQSGSRGALGEVPDDAPWAIKKEELMGVTDTIVPRNMSAHSWYLVHTREGKLSLFPLSPGGGLWTSQDPSGS